MSTTIYQDAYITCTLADQIVTLTYQSAAAAGSIGKAQGESWQAAIEALQDADFQQLNLELNSAGAHFGEPLEGLFHLNHIAEGLWQFRNRGVRVEVICPGWLYGGMAMVLASVANQITLSPDAHMGLFGPKVQGSETPGAIPASDFQPEHLQLTRLTP